MLDNIIDLNNAQFILKKYFGYETLRPGQERIISNILGGKDCLAIMPTGAGKSICYQVPALLLEGITIIVSPLISLMQDQVGALRESGISAAFINSSLSDMEISELLRDSSAGKYKILYVAPERLENSSFVYFSKRADISMVTIDEAHCISQWGQDFRPSYLKIIDYIKQLSKRPLISAFTATATEEVKDDIVCTLQLDDPVIVVTGFDRKNLYYQIDSIVDKDSYIIDYISKHEGDSGIIYCSTRKNVEKIYEKLNRKGISVTRYHAGLSNDERKINQNDFIYDRKLIVVATNAFGMGIDKSNVRFVIHYNMPQSIENYYQEAGRAGRDGERSECILLFSVQDIMTQKYLLDHKDFSESPIEDIDIIRERDVRRLHAMENYCRTTDCLRNYILNYFGESRIEPCGDCSNCNRDYKEKDMTAEAKWVMNCIYETRGKYGLTIVIGTLLGLNRARLREIGAMEYKSYGQLSELGESILRRLITQMIIDGYLVQTDDKYSVLKYGPKAEMLKNADSHVIVRYYEEIKKKTKKSSGSIIGKDMLTKQGYDIFEKLRRLRLEIAREEAMPPYIIFSDKTLVEMSVRLPRNKKELLDVPGVGEAKYQKYGERFLNAISPYIAEYQKEHIDEERVAEGASEIKEPEGSAVPEELKTDIMTAPSSEKKKTTKSEFTLTKEQADGYDYSEEKTVSQIKETLNNLRNPETTKSVFSKNIIELLSTLGYVSEKFIDGVWRKVISPEGKKQGIHLSTLSSDRGNEYKEVVYPANIQKLIVDAFIKRDIEDQAIRSINNKEIVAESTTKIKHMKKLCVICAYMTEEDFTYCPKCGNKLHDWD